MARVVVFGSLNVDFLTRVPRIPGAGETVKGPSYVVLPGGKGANQALAAARMRAKVAMAGAVGKDPFAEIALGNLLAAHVDCSALARVAEPTGAAFISVDPKGENAIVVASGANAKATAESLDKLALTAEDVLLMQRETPEGEVLAALARARKAGATVMLNAAPIEGITPALLDGLDHLILNEHEAQRIVELLELNEGLDRLGDELRQSPESATVLAEALYRYTQGATTLIVTLGAKGALLRDAQGSRVFPALHVEVVDTTGAGDAFCGAYAAVYAACRDAARAVIHANAAAGLACAALGAQTALPSADQVESRLSA